MFWHEVISVSSDSGWQYTYLLHLLTYLLTPCSRVLLEKLTGFQLVKKFPAFYGTRRFITTFTSARHLSLSWASSIQSIPPLPTSWRSILILSSHLLLGLPSGLFPSVFHTKILYTPLLSPTRATCPAHLILLDFITQPILGEQYRSFRSSLCSFLHFPLTSSLLGPNILLNTYFQTPSAIHNTQSSLFNVVTTPERRRTVQNMQQLSASWRVHPLPLSPCSEAYRWDRACQHRPEGWYGKDHRSSARTAAWGVTTRIPCWIVGKELKK